MPLREMKMSELAVWIKSFACRIGRVLLLPNKRQKQLCMFICLRNFTHRIFMNYELVISEKMLLLLNCKLFPNVKVMLRVAYFTSRPEASEVLTAYLLQCSEPPWTSYFVKYSSVKDDQFGKSNFNWKVGSSNYQILRTGCFPYIKYHCSRRIPEDLGSSDKFMRIIKVVNLGIPCLLYGLAATQLIKHKEIVHTTKGPVTIYFLLPEHKGSFH